MKKPVYIVIAVLFCLWPASLMAQPMRNFEADAAEARLNRDGYPYTVMNGPIYTPEERRKLEQNRIQYQQYLRAREASVRAQFRRMSADERRYVIENQGFPQAVMPGIK